MDLVKEAIARERMLGGIEMDENSATESESGVLLGSYKKEGTMQ